MKKAGARLVAEWATDETQREQMKIPLTLFKGRIPLEGGEGATGFQTKGNPARGSASTPVTPLTLNTLLSAVASQ